MYDGNFIRFQPRIQNPVVADEYIKSERGKYPLRTARGEGALDRYANETTSAISTRIRGYGTSPIIYVIVFLIGLAVGSYVSKRLYKKYHR